MKRLIVAAMIAVFATPALAGQIGAEDRQTLAEYQTANGLSDAQMRERFGAVLRIECPQRVPGSGVLVGPSTVLTAEHVIFGSDMSMGDQFLRGCTARSVLGGPPYDIREDNFVRGSRALTARRLMPERDILVVSLTTTAEMTPLTLGRPPKFRDAIRTAFALNVHWRDGMTPGTGSCAVVNTKPEATLSDCDMDGGGSGGPILDTKGRVVGITIRRWDGGAIHLTIPPGFVD